jgi:hypothetical protein
MKMYFPDVTQEEEKVEEPQYQAKAPWNLKDF